MGIMSKVKAWVCGMGKAIDHYDGYVISEDDSYTYSDYVDDMRAEEEARLRMEDAEEQAYCDDIDDRQAQ